MSRRWGSAVVRSVVISVAAVLALSACTSGAIPADTPPTADHPMETSPSASPSPAKQAKPDPDGDLAFGVTTNASRLTLRRGPSADAGVKASLKMANPLGQQLVLLVDKEEEGWFRVLLPERPNGSTGWVPDRSVHTVKLHERIEIDLSKYTLEWFRDGRLVDRFKVGIGQPQWPTPEGEFYVWAKVPQPGSTGAYGVYALGLSGFSPVLSDWPGGGRAAIHGTAAAWNKGKKVSHGCIRVFNPDMERLKHLPLGTPVTITR
jgi:lipoprotein-anchoring transpeptidase ErfK/SrfK